jgi:hypothetical protein
MNDSAAIVTAAVVKIESKETPINAFRRLVSDGCDLSESLRVGCDGSFSFAKNQLNNIFGKTAEMPKRRKGIKGIRLHLAACGEDCQPRVALNRIHYRRIVIPWRIHADTDRIGGHYVCRVRYQDFLARFTGKPCFVNRFG